MQAHKNILTRSVIINNTSIKDENERIIEVSFSSEEPYKRSDIFTEDWIEILGHQTNEVDLTRINNKAPVFYNHDRTNKSNRIGVVETAWLENNRGKAILKLSKRNEINDIWKDIQDGILCNVSVGYQINQKELINHNLNSTKQYKANNLPPTYRITSWTPLEISLVDIPADYTVGVGRTIEDLNFINNQKKANMNNNLNNDNLNNSLNDDLETKNNSDNLENKSIETDNIKALANSLTKNNAVNKDFNKQLIKDEFTKLEQQRRLAIREIFKPFNNSISFNNNLSCLYETCLVDLNITSNDARTLLLNELGKNKEPINNNFSLDNNNNLFNNLNYKNDNLNYNKNSFNHNSRIELGLTQKEKFKNYAQEALEFKTGLRSKEELRQMQEQGINDLIGYSLVELARLSLENANINTKHFNKQELVGRAFTNSSSDFPIILSNIADKAMLKGYEEAEEIFERFTSKGNLSDFKIHERFAVSGLNDLDKIVEGGKYKYDTLDERKETIQLATYGKMFCITRQAIINDDLSVFSTIPQKMGRSVKRTIANHVFNLLINNTQKMNDGTVIFNPNHKNYLTNTSATAPSIDSISTMRNLLRNQKDFSSKTPLNIRPQFILAPVALEDKIKVLLASETNPTQTNPLVPNPIRGLVEVLTDARFDDVSTTAWYMLANANIHDVIEVAYLDGNSNPLLEEQQGWAVDGMEYKVRIDFGVKCLDFRTMVKNDGSNS